MVNANNTQLQKYLAHELFHVFAHHNPQLREALYRVIGVRLWWTLRKLKKMQAEAGPISATRDSGNPVIDGDFQVVERENNNPRLPQEPRQ